MSLTFAATVADRGFDVAFELEAGETLAVLGPNGAGKSTLLGLLAGLLAPTAGRAELNGRLLFDVAEGRRVLTEPRHRGVALLAQEALLFPHLTALDNVAFGPRSRGERRRASRSTARRWLERVGVTDLAARRPAELSGGQAQRVAVARALAADPFLLLLDEPLAALDVTVAPALRVLLRDVLAHRSAIIVTHDPLDAFLLADRVLILESGRVVEAGRTRDVLTRPVTAFGARLAGLNLVAGEVTATGFRAGNGLEVPVGEGTPEGPRLALAVRPARVAVARAPGEEPGWSWIRAVVDDAEHRGDTVRVHAAGLSADVTPADVVELGIEPGAEVFLGLRHHDAVVYPV
ncbi:ATP-binding cassette domain-containing protein [Arthrobacter sp. NamB2]|uniref:sulfate/molybdate ABC transporter ATP-binding protein n=1 Tax=Arthrobacter sp. NamB2 TaxID=2576035 RepID=UPI0010CA1B1D|nr:ATP-binding cassette domain-containing protein [Arthrobacter sp. NamB2]TKV29890.1 ATP-binding cassette domain-containing protein [Arthrobacter sp. NamB2]